MVTRVLASNLDAVVTNLAAALQQEAVLAPIARSAVEASATHRLLDSGSPPPGTAAVVTTSGSTGSPKGVCLSASSIRAAVTATSQRLGGPGYWHLVLPAHYVAGLMVLARGILGGYPPISAAEDLSDLSPVPGGRNFVSVVPTQLARVRHQPRTVEALSRFDAVLLGGAAMDPEALAWWRARVPIVTTYGMSETCGGCVYDGIALPGVRVDLADDARISITGEVLFDGYFARCDLTAEVLQGRTVTTRDRGAWSAGRLQVLGRTDDLIISGGVNVDLAEVERLIRGEFAGTEVAVVGLPDAEWGTVVALAGESDLGDLATVRQRLRSRLAPAALPRALARIRLPLTSGGKIDRQALIILMADARRL